METNTSFSIDNVGIVVAPFCLLLGTLVFGDFNTNGGDVITFLFFVEGKKVVSRVKLSSKSNGQNETFVKVVCRVGLICPSVLLRDPLYVHEFGRHCGAAVFATTCCCLVLKRVVFSRGSQTTQPTQSNSMNARSISALLVAVSVDVAYQVAYHLLLHPEDSAAYIPTYQAGLHYSKHNNVVSKIVQRWPLGTRLYGDQNELNGKNGQASPNEKLEDPTPWTVTGDSRTGITFIMNPSVPLPLYHRVRVPSQEGWNNHGDYNIISHIQKQVQEALIASDHRLPN
jgi:hypothetical protein